MGVRIAGKVSGHPIKANLNGTDLLPKVLEAAADEGIQVFFLGGKPGVAQKAKEQLMRRIPKLEVVGVHHGYFSDEEHEKVIEDINRSRARLLLVGLGVPFQEKWIWKFRNHIEAKLFFGVGAFLDFSAGRFTRAPFIFRKYGLEWMYRLYQEPRRLLKRYIFGNMTFLFRTFYWRMLFLPAFFLFVPFRVLILEG